MFTIRHSDGSLVCYHPVSKSVVLAKAKEFNSLFSDFSDYLLKSSTGKSISIWSDCRAINKLVESAYEGDFKEFQKDLKGYNCLITTNPYVRAETMIFLSERRLWILDDDGSITKFRLKGGETVFDVP